ncbi:MAG TPA: hypothetical protein ENI77_08760 [Nitrospirae bacterium]|nr:hypothetical protein [Nitrospirota bacterium]
MKYFVFLDNFDLWPVISGMAEDADDLVIVKIGAPAEHNLETAPGRILSMPSVKMNTLKNFRISGGDRVVIIAADPEKFIELIDTLSAAKAPPNILVMRDKQSGIASYNWPNVSVINLPAIAKERLCHEWRLIDIRLKANKLKKILSGAENILIMTQNNPDPDAIASGLALQALLGRNRNTAPIATLEKVTRNENLAMIQLLKTNVKVIKPAQIARFDRVVMVDVQPAVFAKGLFDKVDVVIDHHPCSSGYEARFLDANVSYGATSTMMYEYLSASGVKISKRVATALLYGIITDTMMLTRESSNHDFEAFSRLWPLANNHLLNSMSRSRLDPDELGYFVKAIHNRRVTGEFLYIWLGRVKKEDIIPRLADFSLQIGDTRVSAVCGVHRDNLVVSIRNIIPDIDIGKLSGTMFSRWGSAGGHSSMAKAVVPVEKFQKAYSIRSLKQVDIALNKMFEEAIAAINR